MFAGSVASNQLPGKEEVIERRAMSKLVQIARGEDSVVEE